MVRAKEAGKDFEVVKKPKPPGSRRRGLPALDAELIKQQVAPLVAGVPSQRVDEPLSGEVLPPEPATVDQFAAAISSAWEDVQKRFLYIGRLLDTAESKLAAADLTALIGRLPFGKSARSQLLTAYRAINSGRVPEVVAPAGYSTVYLLASMSDEERSKAERAGLFRADVRQAEVKAFRERLRSAENEGARRKVLEARRERLLKALKRIDEELAGLVD